MRFMLIYDNNLNMLKLGLIDQENIQMGLDNVLVQMPFWRYINLQIMPTLDAWYEENKE